MKTATYTVHADQHQAVRWNRAAAAEGFASTGRWLAAAADAYLKVRARAGLPMPLAWRRGRFPVTLEDGSTVTLPGFLSPPFGAFRGTAEGPGVRACHRYTLVHTPTRRIVATLRTVRQCKALASELAPLLLRDEQAAAAVTARHVREAL